ncbi:MAG: hypothetical protein UR43_C0019G0041 [candidate division TM6 bacterium GW2011_GWF2_33_332]|nr:MAG: hypothetical protein UR43_C0019G0041 [candidate division TM6 bacterium GW2011_GWF2_33_332]
MNEVSISNFAKGMTSSPIGQRTVLPQGTHYRFEKKNNDYNIIVEIAPKVWQAVKDSNGKFTYFDAVSKSEKPIPTDSRWIMLNTGFEQTTKKTIDTSVTLDFKDVPLKSVLRMKVTNDKGYSSLDLVPLTTKELKALTATEIN